MLGCVVAQQPGAVAVQHRAGGEHFGIKQRPTRQQAMEKPAMPVSPFHHRGDAENPIHDTGLIDITVAAIRVTAGFIL
jgi:hypothetical protein